MEFAVVRMWHRTLVAEGPYARRLATIKVRDKGGRIVKRTKTVSYGPWTVDDSEED